MDNLDYAPPAVRQTRKALIYMALFGLSGIILARSHEFWPRDL